MRRIALTFLCAASAVGCSVFYDPFRGLPLAEPPPELAPYRITPGDVVSVRQVNVTELDVDFLVPSDGSVSLPLLGDVQVGGRTLEELRGRLIELWRPILRDPDPVVALREARGARVTIGGQVRWPHRTTLSLAATVGDAVRAAGGLLPTGAAEGVVLVRREESAAVRGWKIGFSSDGNSMADRVALRAGDLVYAPPSRIHRLGTWIEQHVNRMLPGGAYFYFWFAYDATAQREEAIISSTSLRPFSEPPPPANVETGPPGSPAPTQLGN